MQTSILYIIIGVLIVGFGALFYFLMQLKKRSEKPTDGDAMKLLLHQMNELSNVVDRKMSETTKHMNESMKTQFTESSKLIKDVTQGLVKLDQTNQQVVSFADQLRQLQDILKNPKQRGVLGEYYLETLLKNVLPPGSYEMQKSFPDGTIVDAVVFVHGGGRFEIHLALKPAGTIEFTRMRVRRRADDVQRTHRQRDQIRRQR